MATVYVAVSKASDRHDIDEAFVLDMAEFFPADQFATAEEAGAEGNRVLKITVEEMTE